MRVAEGASHFVAAHPETQIYFTYYVFFSDGRPKARPARAGVEFRIGAEKSVCAADTTIEPGIVILVVRAAEGSLGVCLARNVKFVGTEQMTPIGVALDNLWHGLNA